MLLFYSFWPNKDQTLESDTWMEIAMATSYEMALMPHLGWALPARPPTRAGGA
jgi:hypothetical protein